MKNYLVLAFESEESVAIGSSTWVQGTKNYKKMDRVTTLFPKKLSAANSMAKNHTPLNLHLNATMEVAKILGISEDWTKVRKVLEKAEETSHLSSSLEQELPKKKSRKVKVPERFRMSDSSLSSSPEPPPRRKIRAELNTEVQNELHNIIRRNDSQTQMEPENNNNNNNNMQESQPFFFQVHDDSQTQMEPENNNMQESETLFFLGDDDSQTQVEPDRKTTTTTCKSSSRFPSKVIHLLRMSLSPTLMLDGNWTLS